MQVFVLIFVRQQLFVANLGIQDLHHGHAAHRMDQFLMFSPLTT
jgi:hypothetical protein